jgi:DNA invertase Pin-like site-specific DNA recombinase
VWRADRALIGYARVSTSGQLLDRQQHALAEAGCLRVFVDKLSGKDADRPELAGCLDYLRPGDTLVVPSLDRLARSLADLITVAGTLRRRGVGVQELARGPGHHHPGGRLLCRAGGVHLRADRQGTREGLDAARGRGARLGRPPVLTAEQIRHARDLLTRPDNTVSSIARLLGVSRATISARQVNRDAQACRAAPTFERSTVAERHLTGTVPSPRSVPSVAARRGRGSFPYTTGAGS